jgi:subtilisin
MAPSGSLRASGYTLVLAFHKMDSAGGVAVAAGLKARFPDPATLFADLRAARTESTPSASYLKRAVAADAPITYPHLGITLGYADAGGLERIRSHRDIAAAYPAPLWQPIRPVRAAAATLSQTHTWGLRQLRIPQLWAEGLTGKGVVVGHLDTGVDGKHPALKGRIEEFGEWDYLGRKKPRASPHDSGDHGTHTAATICGVGVNGRHVDVAPGAKLFAGLVIEGGNTTARILGGLDWLVENRVRVASLSLGYPGYDPVFLELIRRLMRRNVLPVFAIGNEGPNTSRSPGNYPGTLAIGASDDSKRTAAFSSSHHFKRKRDANKPNVVAPGVDVISAKPGGGYQTMDGTSMATPHVAGVAALLLEARPQATARQLMEALKKSAEPLKGEPPLRHGSGLIRPAEALAML